MHLILRRDDHNSIHDDSYNKNGNERANPDLESKKLVSSSTSHFGFSYLALSFRHPPII